MPGDLLIITPSRGRPASIARLLAKTHQLRRAETHVHVCVDADDPALEDYQKVFAQHAADGDGLSVGARLTLTGWTNKIAVKQAGEYRCLASFGDDHVPRTPGFDRALVTACTQDGPAVAYPWDGMREDIPEAPVVDSRIVQALGWFLNPALDHYFVDDTLGALGRGAGCLHFLRAVAVDHVHPNMGTAAGDTTYQQSSAKIPADKGAYQAWRAGRMAADVAAVKALRESLSQPA
ncbi:MAG TPA: hypothetical protein VMK84_04165 [Streptosporangiaceae bacterium]|nr:hypothetical protein [Streptosporangiaceae bacterium]